ncbi:hypothetical protein Tco_0144269 [Tanacetum coccineum]
MIKPVISLSTPSSSYSLMNSPCLLLGAIPSYLGAFFDINSPSHRSEALLPFAHYVGPTAFRISLPAGQVDCGLRSVCILLTSKLPVSDDSPDHDVLKAKMLFLSALIR